MVEWLNSSSSSSSDSSSSSASTIQPFNHSTIQPNFQTFKLSNFQTFKLFPRVYSAKRRDTRTGEEWREEMSGELNERDGDGAGASPRDASETRFEGLKV